MTPFPTPSKGEAMLACPFCKGPMHERIAPVQGYSAGIPWTMHLRAYDVYCKRHGKQQALIEGGCRGGFGAGELDMFIPGWREELSEMAALKKEIAAIRAAAQSSGVREALVAAIKDLQTYIAGLQPGDDLRACLELTVRDAKRALSPDTPREGER